MKKGLHKSQLSVKLILHSFCIYTVGDKSLENKNGVAFPTQEGQLVQKNALTADLLTMNKITQLSI